MMNAQVGRSGSGSGCSSESSDGEEQEESSSSHEENKDVLASFREKWQKELQISPAKQKSSLLDKSEKDDNLMEENDFESKAKALFLKGVELEKCGKLYEAIQFYRRAVQIVPDIEFKIDNFPKQKLARERQDTQGSEEEVLEVVEQDDGSGSDDELSDGELLLRIQKKLYKSPNIFFPHFEQRTTHISILPLEIILYILRWVVSADLDLRSLEICSMVSRGMYLCARDQELWKLACLRVWGRNCGSLSSYSSWREMFIERPRLLFNGCYISKTTYIRPGENSFQDQFYQPWHLIAYYRYLRFFPDGTVLMLTSSDEIAQSVGQLKYKNARPPVLSGHYRLKDDKVTLAIHRQDNAKAVSTVKKNKRRDNMHEAAQQTFHMELQIKSQGKKRHIQLVWKHYSVFQRTKRGDESTCNFDLVTNRFPPLWFSRVKSYTSETESLLR